MSSIFLFSERNRMCVELKTNEISTHDLVDLECLLPRNLKGISFSEPSMVRRGNPPMLFRSEGRQSHVSRYMRNVGEKLLGMGQALGALRFFDLSLKVHQEPQVSLLRSQALVALGRMDEAERELGRFLQDQPHNGLAHFLFGRIYLSRNDYQAAERYFRRAQALLPEGDPQRGVTSHYIGFNQLFLDRDALYPRDLSPRDYVREIENLIHRVQQFKAQVLTSSHEEVRGMEPHLDTMVKLFHHWRAEIIARNQEFFPPAPHV